MKPGYYKTLFLSDVHLGTPGCQAELLVDFLRHHDAEKIYLIGDIVDGWRLKRGWFWPQDHNDVVQKLLRKARKGSEIIYVPGNHDEFLRDFSARISAASRCATATFTKRPTAAGFWSSMATSSTWWCAMPAGSRISATGPTLRRCSSTWC